MAKPILTLTTDFGLTYHFVGVMKGVILSICPQAQIVDISHEVAPLAIAEGAYLIAQAYPYFPKNAVHIVVIDPGVGTARRPILVEAAGQYFVAPDTGVLEMIYSRERHQVRAITDARIFLQPVSHTFHGRDIFAPAAAYLAAVQKRHGNPEHDPAQRELRRVPFRLEKGGTGRETLALYRKRPHDGPRMTTVRRRFR